MLTWLGNQAAEITAVCALLFTAYQAHLQRQHNRVSLRPHLTTFTTASYQNGEGEIVITLENNGLGPAVIKKYQVFSHGIACKPEDALPSVIKDIPLRGKYTKLVDGHVFSEKEKIPILVATFPCNSDFEINAIGEKIENLDLLVEYTCFYGKQLTFDSRKECQQIFSRA